MSRLVITEWSIRKKIRKLRHNAASGPDEIGPKLLQELENEVVKPLLTIFRASMERGEVPEDWKRASSRKARNLTREITDQSLLHQCVEKFWDLSSEMGW